MAKDVLEKLSQSLDKIDRPGTFCVSGEMPTTLPGLEVKGLGPIGLPLTVSQAKQLKKVCQQAPYGKGEETVVDTSVRRVWQLTPDQFSLKNPEWEKFVGKMVTQVREELGLQRQKLESHLYDLLLYEPGSFFKPHKDGEKLERMVATLVIALPSVHEGGELVVWHDGQKQTIDFSKAAGALHTHFAAFYADCEHEILPIREGYRLCLVYNLTLSKARKSISAPKHSEHLERIVPLVQEWAEADASRKLVILLDHQYTQNGLAWDALKGVDQVKARVLAQAGRQAGCQAYLALLTFHESGGAEYADGRDPYYLRRGRWRDYFDDEEDDDTENAASQYEMTEVFESSLIAEHFSDEDGGELPMTLLRVDETELLDPDALTAVDPEEDFEGYTGNAGMTLDRWYRHGAILLWPKRRHFEILCGGDGRQALPVLKQMLTRWRQASAKDKPALKSQCHDLAATILATWPAQGYAYSYRDEAGGPDVVKMLLNLDDPQLIRRFLGEVVLKDVAVDPASSITKAGHKHGWRTFQPELRAIFDATNEFTLRRNVRLLEEICSARAGKDEEWRELCPKIAESLVAAVEKIDEEKANAVWRAAEPKRAELLAALTRALLLTEQDDLLKRVVTHALALPKKYSLSNAHVPALEKLQPWLKRNLTTPSAALNLWLHSCCEQLEELTAQPPKQPADFRRAAPISCTCAHCGELKRFLNDPNAAEHRFSLRQDFRNHLESHIRTGGCDLDLKTERTRSPHTLVCTKNTHSFHAQAKEYKWNRERLATMRDIERSVAR